MKTNCKSIRIVLLAIAMVLCLTACGIDFSTTSNSNDNEESSKIGESSESNNPASISVDNPVQTNDTWKITYQKCQTKDKMDSFTPAEEGTEFVVVFFEIENITEEEQTFSILLCDFYIDGVKTPQTLYGVSVDNSLQLASLPLKEGRKANGYMLFEAPTDWKELEIIYNESLIHTDDEKIIKFNLTKQI